MPESVLVIPRADLFPAEVGSFTGYRSLAAEADRASESAWDPLARCSTSARFLLRTEAETDATWKQLIPYAAILRPADQGLEVFWMRRRKGASEVRLHEKASIGVGGHVNPVDGAVSRAEPGSVSQIIEAGLLREIEEEIVGPAGRPVRGHLQRVGWINDDRNEVGRVHFGVAYSLLVGEVEVRVRETDRLEGAFLSIDEALSRSHELETWSTFLLQGLLDERELLSRASIQSG